ncbi:MAG: hypothetical protein Fur009_5140 [Candidatus Microgenomates bacterium]
MKKISKKIIKIGLYNPYLDTLGGGEKHILSIIDNLSKILLEKNYQNQITIFWNKNILKELLKRFSFLSKKNLKFYPSLKTLNTLQTLKILKNFDYFFYVADGSYFFSTAKKNYIFSMIPDKKLYQKNLINILKLWNFKFITNSRFTSFYLNKWGIKNIVIEPYIEKKFYYKNEQKENIILSVGRFFPHLHSKNHEKIINTFLDIQKKSQFFKSYKLILAGGLKNEDKNYFENLKKIAKNNSSIIFKPNIKTNELINIYHKTKYFWHFTGLGIDEKKYPEKVEHFGIAPLEAIASGCITFCHNSGGPKMILKNGKTGFLFNNENNLIKNMIYIEKNQQLQNQIIKEGIKMIKEKFNQEIFKQKIKLIL